VEKLVGIVDNFGCIVADRGREYKGDRAFVEFLYLLIKYENPVDNRRKVGKTRNFHAEIRVFMMQLSSQSDFFRTPITLRFYH